MTGRSTDVNFEGGCTFTVIPELSETTCMIFSSHCSSLSKFLCLYARIREVSGPRRQSPQLDWPSLVQCIHQTNSHVYLCSSALLGQKQVFCAHFPRYVKKVRLVILLCGLERDRHLSRSTSQTMCAYIRLWREHIFPVHDIVQLKLLHRVHCQLGFARLVCLSF